MTAKATAWTTLGPLVGIVLGGVLGTEIPAVMTALGFIGDTFIGGLTLLSLVVAVTALFNAVNGLGDSGKVKFAFFKNLGFWGGSIVLGIALALVAGQVLLGGRTAGSIAQMQLDLPSNLAVSHSVVWLGGILIAIALGLASNNLKSKVRSLVSWFKNVGDTIDHVTGMVMTILPLGLVFIVGSYVARDGYQIRAFSQQAGSLALTTVIALAVFAGVILPLMITLIGRVNPLEVYGKILPAIFVSLGSMSSRLALPLVLDGINRRKESDLRATGLAASLGTLFNVAPTVIVVMIAVNFMANATGVAFPIYELVLIGLLTVGLSIGVGSTAGATLPIVATALTLTGDWGSLSAAFMVVGGTAWLLEPLRAVVTTLGDAASAAVLSETFEFKTALRSPARTSPRRFGDKPDRSEQRGRTSERSGDRGSDRSRGRKKDDSRDRKGRDRGPSERPDERRSRQESFRGRDRRDQRNDASRPDNRRDFPRKPGDDQRSRDEKPAATASSAESDSPFAMQAVDPALEMGGAVVVTAAAEEKSSADTGRDRSSDRDRNSDQEQRRSSRRGSNNQRRFNEARQGRDRQRPDRRPQERDGAGKELTTTESKSVPEAEIPVESRPSDAITEPKESLTRNRIQYELAKVSEQLRSMDERLPDDSNKTAKADERERPEPSQPVTEAGSSNDLFERPVAQKREEPRRDEPKPVKAETPQQAESTEERPARVETPSDDSAPTEEPAESRSGISDEEKKLAASFGRSRDRRAPRQPLPSERVSDDNEHDSADAEPVAVEAPSNETNDSSEKEIEFGRKRRKKKLR